MSSQPKAETPAFLRKQYEFAAHIRDPLSNPPPADVEDRRMGIYRELLYNNVEGFLQGGFPILRKIMQDNAWHAMVRDFFSQHQCQTPYFSEIAEEFVSYLREERGKRPEDPPFLLELAHYEWVELALDIAVEDDTEVQDEQRGGGLLEGIPVLSKLAWPLAYQFPVHQIGPAYLPQEPPQQPTYLVVYRNRQDEVGFLEINAVTFRLLQLLREDPSLTGHGALERIAQELAHPDSAVVIQGGLDILKNLYFLDIVIGLRNPE